ncbi:MAG: hypothetical protein ACRC3J_05005 [Culicoidibacterales bacterium]
MLKINKEFLLVAGVTLEQAGDVLVEFKRVTETIAPCKKATIREYHNGTYAVTTQIPFDCFVERVDTYITESSVEFGVPFGRRVDFVAQEHLIKQMLGQ